QPDHPGRASLHRASRRHLAGGCPPLAAAAGRLWSDRAHTTRTGEPVAADARLPPATRRRLRVNGPRRAAGRPRAQHLAAVLPGESDGPALPDDVVLGL